MARTQYVDNKKFNQAFKVYLTLVRPLREVHDAKCEVLLKKGASKKDLPKFARPQTPEYDFIGECLLKIAEHLSFKYSFIGSAFYSLRDEMIGDALENAITYLENFDIDKYDNPFAYFTQIMTYAFYRRMTREQTQSYIKKKSLESSENFFSTQGGDESTGYANTYTDFVRDVSRDVIKDFEEKKAKKKSKQKTRKKIEDPGVDKFMVTTEVLLLEEAQA